MIKLCIKYFKRNCFLCKNSLIAKSVKIIFNVNMAIPTIGTDSNRADPNSLQEDRTKKKSVGIIERKLTIPEFFTWLKNINEENGAAKQEITKRAKKIIRVFFVCSDSCSFLIAMIILSKRPTGGSVD